jgi:hypothetical protein
MKSLVEDDANASATIRKRMLVGRSEDRIRTILKEERALKQIERLRCGTIHGAEMYRNDSNTKAFVCDERTKDE